MYACTINTYVPHEVKYQRALAKRTPQPMQNGQDVNIQTRSGTRCPRQSKHTLPHASVYVLYT